MGKRTGRIISCEYCGKEVYKPLSELKKSKKHFCSLECWARYRWKRNSLFKKDLNISKENLAYIAGLIDGEGYLSISYAGKTQFGEKYSYWEMGIAMTSYEALDFVRKKLKIKRKIIRREKTKSGKQVFRLEISEANGLYQILLRLFPYLIVKKKQVKQIIQELRKKYGFS